MLLAALKLQIVALASVAGVDSDTLNSPKVKPIIESLEKAVKDAGTDAAKTQTALITALDEVKKLAEGTTPDKDALYILGLWARNGLVSNASGQQVLDFYERAAAGTDGPVLAKVELAQILLQSFQQDPARAAQARALLDEAVAAKNNAARFIKANFLLNAQAGYASNVDEAKALLEAGSADGDGACTFGLYQLVGRGVTVNEADGKQTEKVKKDAKAAVALLEKAVEQKNPNAMTEYAQRLIAGDTEIPKNVAKAVDMFKTAAASGSGFASRQIGIMHEQGGVEGVEKDATKALEFFMKAANANDPAALLWLGNAAQTGFPTGTQDKPVEDKDLLVKRDVGTSLTMYRRAALGGSAEAIYNVGAFYESGTLVDKDAEKAFQLFHRAAVNGLPAAMMKVASAYQNGGGVAQDPVAAEGWYNTAARAGVPAALAIVGQIALSRGDTTNGVVYLEGAAAGGLPQAMAALAGIYNQGVQTQDGKGAINKSPTSAWVWTTLTAEAIKTADPKQAAEVQKRADEIAAKFSAAEKTNAEKALSAQKKRLDEMRTGVKAAESTTPAADTKGGATKGKGK
jgi:uncharacterized protein